MRNDKKKEIFSRVMAFALAGLMVVGIVTGVLVYLLH